MINSSFRRSATLSVTKKVDGSWFAGLLEGCVIASRRSWPDSCVIPRRSVFVCLRPWLRLIPSAFPPSTRQRVPGTQIASPPSSATRCPAALMVDVARPSAPAHNLMGAKSQASWVYTFDGKKWCRVDQSRGVWMRLSTFLQIKIAISSASALLPLYEKTCVAVLSHVISAWLTSLVSFHVAPSPGTLVNSVANKAVLVNWGSWPPTSNVQLEKGWHSSLTVDLANVCVYEPGCWGALPSQILASQGLEAPQSCSSTYGLVRKRVQQQDPPMGQYAEVGSRWWPNHWSRWIQREQLTSRIRNKLTNSHLGNES